MKSAGRTPLAVVAGMALALIFNLTMLPYTTWFKIAMFSAFPIACLLGIKYDRRPS
jgi:hypothetical protein